MWLQASQGLLRGRDRPESQQDEDGRGEESYSVALEGEVADSDAVRPHDSASAKAMRQVVRDTPAGSRLRKADTR
jgi:hypothetical protein